jgi:hypothetical protein
MHRSKNRVSNDVARHYAPPSPSADPWKKYRGEGISTGSSRNSRGQDSESYRAWLFAVVFGFSFMMIAGLFFAAFVIQCIVYMM